MKNSLRLSYRSSPPTLFPKMNFTRVFRSLLHTLIPNPQKYEYSGTTFRTLHSLYRRYPNSFQAHAETTGHSTKIIHFSPLPYPRSTNFSFFFLHNKLLASTFSPSFSSSSFHEVRRQFPFPRAKFIPSKIFFFSRFTFLVSFPFSFFLDPPSKRRHRCKE